MKKYVLFAHLIVLALAVSACAAPAATPTNAPPTGTPTGTYDGTPADRGTGTDHRSNGNRCPDCRSGCQVRQASERDDRGSR